ncbi:hypothetical protein KM043_017026 [Ampulex compressa]|nr:hypothetical protein KM043_017026 [Ampulex compressa]
MNENFLESRKHRHDYPCAFAVNCMKTCNCEKRQQEQHQQSGGINAALQGGNRRGRGRKPGLLAGLEREVFASGISDNASKYPEDIHGHGKGNFEECMEYQNQSAGANEIAMNVQQKNINVGFSNRGVRERADGSLNVSNNSSIAWDGAWMIIRTRIETKSEIDWTISPNGNLIKPGGWTLCRTWLKEMDVERVQHAQNPLFYRPCSSAAPFPSSFHSASPSTPLAGTYLRPHAAKCTIPICAFLEPLFEV